LDPFSLNSAVYILANEVIPVTSFKTFAATCFNIVFSGCESFKTYHMHLYGEDINRKPEDGDGASPRNVVSFKSSDAADGLITLY
jgi:hypothetical protein